jgi:hypothetical protein
VIAFKVYQLCPVDQRPKGIPLAYPWIQETCTEEESIVFFSKGWNVLPEQEYEAYVESMTDLISEYELQKEQLEIPAVSARQIRLALLASGITPEMITASLESLEEPDRTAALIEWEHSTSFEITHPLVANVSGALGWNTEQVNELWAYAYTL